MKSVEDKIDKKSDYFINSPTDAITEYFLYPTHLGLFFISQVTGSIVCILTVFCLCMYWKVHLL